MNYEQRLHSYWLFEKQTIKNKREIYQKMIYMEIIVILAI